MTLEYRIGDVFDRLREIPDGSVDLIVTSPPFLALRSYLPADHPDKAKEIGSEPTPAEFLDTLYALSAEWGRVLAPHGSICVELGDTYSGSGGGGGDYLPGGMKEGQQQFAGSALLRRQEIADKHYEDCDMDDDCSCPVSTDERLEYVALWRERMKASNAAHWRAKNAKRSEWPLAKSLTGIPTLYPWGLAYGRNLLTGQPHDAGQWRIRNVIVWARPNPPVGALGDKFRPATSYITVACRGAKRYFDLDAVRQPFSEHTIESAGRGAAQRQDRLDGGARPYVAANAITHPGAPPLDWHADEHPEDGDWLWKLSTQPYKGSHYATYPLTLPKRLIEAMCPLRVCTVCGQPSERIVGEAEYVQSPGAHAGRAEHKGITSALTWQSGVPDGKGNRSNATDGGRMRSAPTLGWTDCGHDAWRTGIVLDPFAGSGTTLEAAQAVGRHGIGIDIDERNADLAQQRVGMFLTISTAPAVA